MQCAFITLFESSVGLINNKVGSNPNGVLVRDLHSAPKLQACPCLLSAPAPWPALESELCWVACFNRPYEGSVEALLIKV